MSQNRWVVPSETDPQKTYEVVRVGDLFACSCPNYIYRNRICKHILMIKKRLEEEEGESKEEGESDE